MNKLKLLLVEGGEPGEQYSEKNIRLHWEQIERNHVPSKDAYIENYFLATFEPTTRDTIAHIIKEENGLRVEVWTQQNSIGQGVFGTVYEQTIDRMRRESDGTGTTVYGTNKQLRAVKYVYPKKTANSSAPEPIREIFNLSRFCQVCSQALPFFPCVRLIRLLLLLRRIHHTSPSY